MEKLSLEISYSANDDVPATVEFWFGDIQWATLHAENDEIVFEVHLGGSLHSVTLEELERGLRAAKRELRLEGP